MSRNHLPAERRRQTTTNGIESHARIGIAVSVSVGVAGWTGSIVFPYVFRAPPLHLEKSFDSIDKMLEKYK